MNADLLAQHALEGALFNARLRQLTDSEVLGIHEAISAELDARGLDDGRQKITLVWSDIGVNITATGVSETHES